jgi:hypothetical protein
MWDEEVHDIVAYKRKGQMGEKASGGWERGRKTEDGKTEKT